MRNLLDLNKDREVLFPWDVVQPETMDPEIHCRLVNTVVTSRACGRSTGQKQPLHYTEVDLTTLSASSANDKFWPQRKITPTEPSKPKAFVFYSGAFVNIGGNSLLSAVASKYASLKVVYNYRLPGCDEFVMRDIITVNYVYCGYVNGPDGLPIDTKKIRLNLPAIKTRQTVGPAVKVSYDPESFPGCTVRFRMKDGTKRAVVYFGSGKYNLPGITSAAHSIETGNYVYNWLKQMPVGSMYAPASTASKPKKTICRKKKPVHIASLSKSP